MFFINAGLYILKAQSNQQFVNLLIFSLRLAVVLTCLKRRQFREVIDYPGGNREYGREGWWECLLLDKAVGL